MTEDRRYTLYCYDQIRIASGEILTLYGNFDGKWCRARLSFYPCMYSKRILLGTGYKKTDYETGCAISGCRKVLDLPGEQHFLVHRSQIVGIYRPQDAFAILKPVDFDGCMSVIKIMETCGLQRAQHGLMGSRALRGALATSDYDWVIYDGDPFRVKECVTHDARFARELTFPIEYVYTKYKNFTGFERADIDALFANRWKYVRYGNLNVSFSFCDTQQRSDDLLDVTRVYQRVTVTGVITTATGCYYSPRTMSIDCGNKHIDVLTWLFLYNGAFQDGDVVEISGRMCVTALGCYLLVESRHDYIRKVRTIIGGGK